MSTTSTHGLDAIRRATDDLFIDSSAGEFESQVESAIKVADMGWVVAKSGRKITVTYPTTSTEQYTYTQGSIAVATILVTYSDSTKETLTSVERTA